MDACSSTPCVVHPTQLGAELLPLLLENMAFRLGLNLVQIQVVVQGLTFAVPLVSFLVDWPVGTVFIAVAFPFFEHMVEARPVLVGSYFSRRLCIVNPPDGMLPLNLTIDPMLPVLMLQIQLCNTCGNGVVTLKVGLSYFAMNRALLRTRAPTAYFDARTAGFAALVTPSCRLLAHTSVVYDSLPCGPT